MFQNYLKTALRSLKKNKGFTIIALGALCIAFLTVGYQSVKTALTNPVESLRAE